MELGIKREDLRLMAEETVRVSGGGNNFITGTRELTADEIEKIYEACYE